MMLNQFQQQLTLHFPHQSHFLVGLSGGIDSVVLLHLFNQAKATFNLHLRAIHIHHGLSPNADHWVEFCQQLCGNWNIPFTVRHVGVSGKQGIEAEARKARYQAIDEVIQPNEVLATAHHLDDQAETFFLALKRGSGLKGLSAMQAVSFQQNFANFRPLLGFSKGEIIDYAIQNHLQWIEDESNSNTHYDRNFLRQAVLPQLNQRWVQFNRMVARSAEHCAEQQQLIEELLADELNHRIDSTKQRLDIGGFHAFSGLKQQQLIRLWLARSNVAMPSQKQLEQIIQKLILAKQDKNPQVKLGELIVRRYQQGIFITKAFADTHDFAVELPYPLQNSIILPDNIGSIQRNATSLICKFSEKTDRLQLPRTLWDQPLKLKLHHSGKVKIYGKPLREEMKKIWQQHHIPVWQRSRTPLLFFEDQFVMLLCT
ncbi:tRNA lysidine(34) synthetase TilS [Glaesserella sp.]|uniref:tRNA lysidine(34) synthetase TilS n=1 Tax=Glaesserella sp. TaxID=2094731 RepID=UPI0035A16610